MITVERNQLNRAIGFAANVIERRSTVPVLSTIKATANGSLSLEATDLDNYVTAELPYEGDHDSFCIPEPRGLRTAVNVAGGKEVQFTPGERSKLKLSCGALDGELNSYPSDDHPGSERIVEELFGCDMGAPEMHQISRILAAISTEETRYYLNGVCVRKVGDWLYRFCATDGHRLMWVDIPLPSATGDIADGTIIPRRLIQIALTNFPKAKEGARFSYGHAQRSNRPGETLNVENVGMPRVGFSGDFGGVRFTLVGKLIDGTYPDVDRVIPKDSPHFLRLKREALVRAINALTPLSTDRTRAIRVLLGESVTIALQSPDIGNSSYKVEAEHNAPEAVTIGFNAQYLLDMCSALRGDEIELRFTDEASPILIVDPSDTAFGAVQMPMRV